MQKPHLIQIESPTPILNTPDFSSVFGGRDGISIPTSEKGHPLHFEFVALPGMECRLLEQCSEWIFRVSCPRYPGEKLFLDQRFTKEWEPLSDPQMPEKGEILHRMASLLGTPYVWGGNWHLGIPRLLELYPPKGPLTERMRTLWTLSGIDCSGLLFQTTGGLTPRNTSELVKYGRGLKVKGLSMSELKDLLEPLDMILYRGHVLFVLNRDTIIESKSPYGVILRDVKERLAEIGQGRTGQDEWETFCKDDTQFIVRRWLER